MLIECIEYFVCRGQYRLVFIGVVVLQDRQEETFNLFLAVVRSHEHHHHLHSEPDRYRPNYQYCVFLL